MALRKFFVLGYWKCEGTYCEVMKIKAVLSQGEVPPPDVVEVVVCPPGRSFPYLDGPPRPEFQLTSDHCVVQKDGANPWGIPAESLVKRGTPWVVLGDYRERRYLRLSNEFVGYKIAYVVGLGLKVIACVGETLKEREAGKTMDVVAAQTKAIAGQVTNWKNVVLAYIPVWAVGTGKAATPAQAQEVHAELRKLLRAEASPEVSSMTRIIYGGSVNSTNCRELAAQPDIDGFFVGSASMTSEFIDIVSSVEIKRNNLACGQSPFLSGNFRELQI